MRKIIIIVFSFIMSFMIFAGKLSTIDELIDVFRNSFKYNGKISKKLLKTSIGKYGDEFIELSRRYGPDVVKMSKKYGDEGFFIVNRYGDKGIKVLKNYGDEGIKIIGKYGDNIVSPMSKYSKFDLSTLKNYGDEVMTLNKELSFERVIAITEALKLDKNAKYRASILKNGSKIITFIEKHPKFFVGASLTTAIYQVVTNEELNKKAIEEAGKIAEKTLKIGQNTIIDLFGGKNSIALIIRSIIFSLGIIIILYTIMSKKSKKEKNIRAKKVKSKEIKGD